MINTVTPSLRGRHTLSLALWDLDSNASCSQCVSNVS